MKRTLTILALFFAAPLAFAGTCPSPWNSIDVNGNAVNVASAVGITQCYYASKSLGSDSNSGASEASPWAHVPGMNGCSGNCASHSIAVGDAYIMRGGDTWSGSDIGTAVNTYGSSTHWLYYGVDPNWPSSGWTRPIWNMSSAGAGYEFLLNAGSGSAYVRMDDIEVTGMNNSMNGIYAQSAQNIRASQMYFHGWTHIPIGSNNDGFFVQGGSNSVADHNVIDGSDSSKNTMNGVFQF